MFCTGNKTGFREKEPFVVISVEFKKFDYNMIYDDKSVGHKKKNISKPSKSHFRKRYDTVAAKSGLLRS